jgi:hypothetical protein
MNKTLLLSFLACGSVAFAAGKALKVNIFQDSVIEGKTVKAGDYRVTMEGGNAIIKQGKESIVVPAKEESASSKFSTPELLYKDGTNLESIGVKGTTTKIVFENAAATRSGQ